MWIDRARRTFQHLERKELERLQDFEVRVTDRGGKGVANRSSRLAKKAECYCTSTRLINLNCFPHIKAVFQEQADFRVLRGRFFRRCSHGPLRCQQRTAGNSSH